MKTIDTIENWKIAKPGTIAVDWSKAEQALGFELHENFKDFYSRVRISKNRRETLNTVIQYNPKTFVKDYSGSKEGWLEDVNAGRDFCEFTLIAMKDYGDDPNYLCRFVKEAFTGGWTGGNDFGHRAYLGEFLLNTGQISIIFNNDNGKFEWVDFGYGYFDIYEENPFGTLADHAQEFLDKLELK